MDDWTPLPKPTPEELERMRQPGGLLWWREQAPFWWMQKSEDAGRTMTVEDLDDFLTGIR